MQTLTITQEHYSELQMTIAKLLKQVDGLKKQLANTLEIGSHLASNLQEQRDINAKLNNERIVLRLKLEQLEKENAELHRKVKGAENRLNLSKLHIEMLRDTLNKVHSQK